MRAIITVIGKDKVGIIAGVSDILAKNGVNILDITQSVLTDMFAMVLMADISNATGDITSLAKQLDAFGEEKGLKIHCMHEDIFNSMHRI